MAKQIFIQFTSDGAIVQQQSSASNIRQGDADGEVSIVVAFAGRSNADYVARAHFERPDGKHANVVMIPSHQTTNRFEYVIQSAWFFAVAGTAKVTITITSQAGAVAAQGLYAFEIASTTVDVSDSTLTYDEAAALEALISSVGANAVNKAAVITLQEDATPEEFFAACKASYEGAEVDRDGDRFIGEAASSGGGPAYYYAGQFNGQNSMIITRVRQGESVAEKKVYFAATGPNGDEAVEGAFGDQSLLRYGYVTTLAYDSDNVPLGVETTLSVDQTYYLITKNGANLTDAEYREYAGKIVGGDALIPTNDPRKYQCIVSDSLGKMYTLRKDPSGQVRAYIFKMGTAIDFIRLGTTIEGTVDIN